jgi:hypothetical protein
VKYFPLASSSKWTRVVTINSKKLPLSLCYPSVRQIPVIISVSLILHNQTWRKL